MVKGFINLTLTSPKSKQIRVDEGKKWMSQKKRVSSNTCVGEGRTLNGAKSNTEEIFAFAGCPRLLCARVRPLSLIRLYTRRRLFSPCSFLLLFVLSLLSTLCRRCVLDGLKSLSLFLVQIKALLLLVVA